MTALAYTSGTAIATRIIADGATVSSASTAILSNIALGVNDALESYCNRPIGPGGTAARTYDGDDSDELWIPEGLSGISQLRIRSATGGTWSALGSSEYVLRPHSHRRPPGWPAFYIKLTDLATTYSAFTWGYDTVEVTPDSSGFGWASIPLELSELALRWGVLLWQARQSGEAGQVGSADFGQATLRVLTDEDYEVLNRYRFAVSPTYVGGGT